MTITGYQGLFLFYVGAVLLLNGIWLLGHIQDREIALMDFFAGGVGLLVCISLTARAQLTDLLPFEVAAYIFLFTFTYLWVAINRYTGSDGRGLGWFSFFVAVTAIPVTIRLLLNTGGNLWITWLGLNWAAWGVLWFLFFLLLVLKRPVGKLAGWTCILEAVFTGWLPGYLLLTVPAFTGLSI
jgi:putative amide transporter protein